MFIATSPVLDGIVGDFLLDGERDLARANVALETLADRKVDLDRNSVLSQVISRTDSGQHQDL